MSSHHITRHVPATQPIPPSLNRSASQAHHADKPPAVGAHGTGALPPGGMYHDAHIRAGPQAVKPTARRDMLTGARRQTGGFSGLVDQGDDDGGGVRGRSRGGNVDAIASHAGGGGAGGSGGGGEGGGDSKGDRPPRPSFNVAPPRVGAAASKQVAQALANDRWAREALSTGGDVGLMNAFADRVLSIRKLPGDTSGPGPVAHLHIDNRTMLRVTEGRALDRHCVKQVRQRLATASREAGPLMNAWVHVHIVPSLMNFQRSRTPGQLAHAISKRTTLIDRELNRPLAKALKHVL